MSNLNELLNKYQNNETTERFARELGLWVSTVSNNVVIETGLGVSTLYLLKNLPETSKLYTLDPHPFFPDVIEHSNFEWVKKSSEDAVLELYQQVGAFDIFFHDGDHDCRIQSYEINFGYSCLKAGGFFCCEDSTWGGHGAWQKFLDAHKLKDFGIGCVRIVQKPATAITLTGMNMVITEAIERENAKQAEKTFLQSGGKNSEIHEQWQKIRDGK